MPEDHGGFQIVRAAELTEQTAQSAGAVRRSGVGHHLEGCDAIWMGKVSNDPGHLSVAHHHAEAQTAGYVLKGKARIYYGDDYREYVDLDEGDFVFVPPFIPHVEANRSQAEELVWLTARSPDNIVVNLEDTPRESLIVREG